MVKINIVILEKLVSFYYKLIKINDLKHFLYVTFVCMINNNVKIISYVVCRIILTGLYGYILLIP
jgi:hypothetical protein